LVFMIGFSGKRVIVAVWLISLLVYWLTG
jgi:hypothetical protein